MSCYDVDTFRDFVASTAFNEVYDVPWDEMQKILSTDNELMLFAFRFLRQTMFGEETIIMKTDALDKHLARKRETGCGAGRYAGRVSSYPAGKSAPSNKAAHKAALLLIGYRKTWRYIDPMAAHRVS